MGGSFVYMINFTGNRLSRSDRIKLKANRKAKVALALAVALLFLISGKIYWKDLERLLSPKQSLPMDNYAIQALADSLVIQTVREFQLDDPTLVDSLIAQAGGPSYRRVRQAWPAGLPSEFFIERLQKRCNKYQFSCDCVESARRQKTTCTIVRDGVKGAQIVLEADRGARLKGRGIAFVIRNLGAWNNESILEIINKKIKFGYIGTPNTYPTGSTKKTFEAAGIISILELPGRKSGLVGYKKKQNDSSRKKDDSEKELMAEIFERHPKLKVIYFDKTLGYELPFVKIGLSQAAAMKVAYLYNNSAPDRIDSLAYSSGLDIISAKTFADFDKGFEADSIAALLYDLIIPDRPNRRILVFDAQECTPQTLIRLFDTVSALGINIKNCMELADTLKSF